MKAVQQQASSSPSQQVFDTFISGALRFVCGSSRGRKK